MTDLFWPGDERAGATMSEPSFLAAMVEVEEGWLAGLVSAGIAPYAAKADLAGLVGPADVDEIAVAAEAGANPVIPLVSLLRQRAREVNDEAATWLHRGLTSQDVVDTALMLCLREALDRVEADLREQVSALSRLADEHRSTVMAGRTMTQHAVPISFGLKASGWLTGVLDAADAVDGARVLLVVQVGGAAGTMAATTELARAAGLADPSAVAVATADGLAAGLGLGARPPWHTSRRPVTLVGDALVAATDAWGRIASDVATLGRPEIGEVGEPSVVGRGGSSTMPQKQNPVLSVLVRRAAMTAPALSATLHTAAALAVDERPDGAWHAEWATLRTLARQTVVAGSQTTELVSGLRVNVDRMTETVASERDSLLAEVVDRRDRPDHRRGARPSPSLPGGADMSVRIVGTQLSDPGPVGARKPLLVLGPSLGTSVHALWAPCVRDLADRFHLVGWDLPGHGASPAANGSAMDFTDLAAAVIDLVDAVQEERGEPIGSFAYAGDSASGAVGLQLLLDAPDRVRAAVILCSSAAFGVMPGWLDRAAAARASGTASLVPLSLQRWFTYGFAEREPERVSALLHSLRETDDESYAQVCEALSRFDVRDRLSDVTVPLLAVAGSEDVATPPALLEEIAAGIPGTRLVVLDGVAHLPPAEAPSVVVKLLAQHLEPHEESATGIPDVVGDDAGDPLYDKGMTVRRAVLGDAHVDRANAGVTDLTRDFQELITRYAWGSIWTRPGLDRRSRSMITLTALIARGHHEELAMHLRAARTNGLTDDEIKEVILQSAIYCGVPDANTAFRVAQTVLSEPVPTEEQS